MRSRTLSRREFAGALAAGALAPSALRGTGTGGRRGWPEYGEAIVIDALASPGPFNVPGRTERPVTEGMIGNVVESGITAVNVTVNGGGAGHGAFDSTVRELGYWTREVAERAGTFLLVRSAGDVLEAKRSSRLGLIFGFQDAALLEGEVGRLGVFHDFGVRIIQLTYNLRNELGDGCLEPGNAGLSKFGHAVVEGMNGRGMLIDLSHCGQRTTADAIRASARPVSITHSGCRAVYDHPRNKHDAELRALAERGGVIGIYAMPFLNGSGPPRMEHFLAHLEHALQVCGEDHVGVGTDNSITPTVADAAYRQQLRDFAVQRQAAGVAAPREEEVLFVEEMNTPRRMEVLADALLARGHTEPRVEKIIGRNWLRLFEEVWT